MTELVERERRKGGRELEVDMLNTKLSCWSHPSWVFMLRHRQDLLIKRSIVAFSLTLVARWKQDAHSDARGGMGKKEQLVATVDVGRSQNLHLARPLPDKSMAEKSREIQGHKRWPVGKVSPW